MYGSQFLPLQKKKKKSIHNSKFQLIDFWEKQLLAVIYMNDVIFSFSKFWVNKLLFFLSGGNGPP